MSVFTVVCLRGQEPTKHDTGNCLQFQTLLSSQTARSLDAHMKYDRVVPLWSGTYKSLRAKYIRKNFPHQVGMVVLRFCGCYRIICRGGDSKWLIEVCWIHAHVMGKWADYGSREIQLLYPTLLQCMVNVVDVGHTLEQRRVNVLFSLACRIGSPAMLAVKFLTRYRFC